MIDAQLLIDSMPALLRGALISLKISFFGCAIGFVLGTILGLGHTSKSRILRAIITLYVTIMRGTPMLIQIAFAVFVLPEFGIVLPPLWAGILAIGLNSGAYVSQIVRAGINSVPRGQLEAAQVLGLSRFQTTRYILLPQAIRIILPSLGNEFITLIKDSSLLSTVGVMELYGQGSIIRSQTYDALTAYCGVALIYLVMTTTLSILVSWLEMRLNRHA